MILWNDEIRRVLTKLKNRRASEPTKCNRFSVENDKILKEIDTKMNKKLGSKSIRVLMIATINSTLHLKSEDNIDCEKHIYYNDAVFIFQPNFRIFQIKSSFLTPI